ncbi:MAG: hypothetical protein WC794_01770 [Candidatus Doudnabacteria bacterium]|jgi:hypothetical protein
METNQTEETKTLSTEQVLAEILENTRKTKNYMKWSLYITIVLVVLPILAALFILPIAFNSISGSYGALLQ